MAKLVLLTGFLGAGKTTLLQRILDTYQDRRIGVIINEFGKVNVDARLVERPGLVMEELSNGSIFCACIKANFVDSLIELSGRELEYVFVEASGLADPANMNMILDGLADSLKEPYEYKGAVCIIDSQTFAGLYEVLPAINYQLEFCGAAIVNKADLVEEEDLQEILKIIAENNPEARVYVTSYGKVDILELVEELHQPDREARESSNTPASRPVSFVLRGLDTVPLDKLKDMLEKTCSSAYRIKGFAQTDQGCKSISVVGENIEIEDWPENPETEIVVISSVGISIMSVLTRNIVECGLKGVLRV